MPTDGSLARWRSRRGLRIAALLAGVSLSAVAAHAQDATWNLNGTGDFNTSANWTPATVPTGTAIFGVSNQTNVTFSATTSNINSWTFNAGASSYNFTINPTTIGGINFFGAGIVLHGGTANIINNGSSLSFSSGTAGSATISNNGGTVFFSGSSTAGSATIFNNFLPAAAQFPVQFLDSSTAGNATIINNNPLTFQKNSTAGNAIINNNNQLIFFDASTGGTASLINAAAGTVDISFLSNAGMTVGSIEGAGTIALSSKNLAVGGNNLSTTFAGVLQDGGLGGGTGGSLTKTGTGTLTLAGNNTYTGATVVNSGGLIVNGFNGSSSLTTVNNGAVLSGTGTVGNTQINSGGTFAPGSGAPGTSITVRGNLAFQSGAIYLVQLNSTSTSSANVTGTASLGGAVQAVFAPGMGNPAKSYDILRANGLGGTFAKLETTNLPVGFTASLSYTATDVLLNVTAALGGPQQATGLSSNHLSVAGAINNFFNAPPLPPAFLPLFSLTGANLTNALTLLSGEAATGAQQAGFQLTNQFLNIMLDPFVDGRSNVKTVAPSALRPSARNCPTTSRLRTARYSRRRPSRPTSSNLGACGGRAMAAATARLAKVSLTAAMILPRAPRAAPPASIIASHQGRWWASRSLAAAPTGTSRRG